MSFAIPKSEKGIILYLWQMLDLVRVNQDFLYSIMAFEVHLGPLEKCKMFIENAVNKGLLIEHTEEEEVELNPELQQEFNFWQAEGEKKAFKMRGLLEEPWRETFTPNDNMIYQVMERDLIDPSVRENCNKILGSNVHFDLTDFDSEISGYVISTDEMQSQSTFNIDIKKRTISHSCNEYDLLRKNQQHFCVHLARVIVKLYAQEKAKTTQLVQNLVSHKNEWTF